MVYRYFNANSTINIERELAIIRKKVEDCELCKHYGNILSSYIYDFKEGTQNEMLSSYNAIEFNRYLINNIMSLKPRMIYAYDYKPNKIPNAIFVLVYNNRIVSLKTK